MNMRTILLTLLLAPAAAAQAVDLEELLSRSGAPAPAGAPEAIAAIERAGLARHAFTLASDEFGGRHTGTPGQEQAARYIAAHFEAIGLEPLGDENEDGTRDWLQRYPVRRTHLDPAGTMVHLGAVEHAAGFAVMPGREREVDVDGELVFCGRGRRSEMPDAFEDGQIPVVFVRTRPTAQQLRPEMQFMMGFREIGKLSGVARRAADAGAEVLLVLDLSNGLADVMQYGGILPGKPQLAYGSEMGMGAMLGSMGGGEIPFVVAGAPLSKEVLQYLELVVDEDGAVAQTEPVPDASARVRAAVKREAGFDCTNVVAVLRGSDPELAGEAVVFSAHMDHMGTRLDGEVFNGADDNASGSSGLLEIAEAFAQGERPRRSIVFLSVSGEELGLWGSEHFSRSPTWPWKDIVADINIDMIGRATKLSDANQISATPSYRHAAYSTIGRDAAQLAAELELELTNGDEYYERSDHYNFAKNGVPVVFFCDGEHEDYHQVSDTPDKLDYEKMERVARLAYWTGWTVAQADGRPEVVGRQRDWLEAEEEAGGEPR